MVRIGVIGAGNIGTEVVRQAREKGYDVGPVATTSGVYDISELKSWTRQLKHYLRQHPKYKVAETKDYKAPFRETDVVFLAIPTLDNGEDASRYLDELFEEGKPVITCEKGALSLDYKHFLESIEQGMLGYRATVGGGTSILPYMRERVRSGFVGMVYAIINGTVNFIFDGLANGRSLGEMTFEAKKLDYAEPGAEEALDVVNMEVCEDIPRKSTILFNDFIHSFGGKEFITSNDVKATVRRITPKMFNELIRQAGNRRYIVSIKKRDDNEESIMCRFNLELDGWRLDGGFRQIGDDPLYKRLLPNGVDNSILITEGADESKGVYSLKGPGAGAPPTTAAMMRDLNDMIKAGIVNS